MNYLLPLDILALLAMFWTAQAALAGGHEVETWSDILLSLGLIGVKVSSVVGAAVLFAYPDQVVSWWQRGLIYSSACVALWFYEYRFGIARHWRMYVHAAREIPADVRRWAHGLGERLRGRTPSKRKPHA